MRIAIASAKGGVAKTTTAMFLAAAARRRDMGARVLDADPQASASVWADTAAETGTGVGFEVVPANLSTVSKKGREGVWEFVDCPPSGRLLEVALKESDFVIVPSSDSATDLQQAWATLDIGSTPRALLLTRVEPRTRAFQASLEALTQAHTPRFDTVVAKRQAVKTAFGTSSDHLFEYGQVFQELLSALREVIN